jgi:hypothetical protein
MSDYSGRKVAYGFAIEGVRGVAEADPQVYIPHLDQDFTDKQEKALNNSALGVLDVNNDSIVVKEWSEGKFDAKVQSNNFGYLLLAAFGSVSSGAGVAVGTRSHTFSSNNSNQSQSLTVFKYTPNESLAYALAVVNTLEIEAVVGEYVKASLALISKKGASDTLTPAYDTEDEIEFTAKHLNLYMDDYGTAFATVVSAGDNYPVKSVKIKLDRMAEAYFETGSVTPYEIHNKGFDVTLEVEKRYSDTTFKVLSQDNTKKACVVVMENTDEEIGTNGNPLLQFNLPKVVVNDHEPSEGLEDIAEESFTLQGLFDTDSGLQCQAVLVNTVQEYVAPEESS